MGPVVEQRETSENSLSTAKHTEMRASAAGHCSCSRARRGYMAGALMPMIVCMMLSMLRKTLRIDWEGKRRGEGVRVEHGCLDKDKNTFGDQSPALTANAPRSRSEFEAWRGGLRVSCERKNPKPSQPHIGGKSCRGGTGSKGTFFSDGAGATGCTAATLGVMRNSSWGVTGFTGTTRPTENLYIK